MAIKDRNFWIGLLFICAGLVIGGLLGEVAKQVDWLSWLGYGQTFGIGIDTPFSIKLNVLTLTFAFALHINIASIIGLSIAIFLYRKMF